MSAVTYPVRVEAALDSPLSRWLWLVKWLLAIPHYVVLGFLWIAFFVMSVVAFVSIVVTGRYPKAVFEFNVGVLRWTWRVAYYAYGALATDRYPPFTLAEVPDYPAHLDVAYPDHLSRGLALVKWWLLAIPHYIVVGLFMGGGTYAAWRADTNPGWAPAGLIGVLVIVAAVVLAFTGRYPRSIYDFVLGMNRWVLRVAAYAALMTDDYPPFRLDMGPQEPVGTLTVPAPQPQTPPSGPPAAPRGGWTAGRIISVVAGAVLALVSLGLLAGGGVLLGLDRLGRDDGYITSSTRTFTSPGYAVVGDNVRMDSVGPSWAYGSSMLDKVRVRVRSDVAGKPVFVGIAPTALASSYLTGVQHTRFGEFATRHDVTQNPGAAPAKPPAAAGIWTTSVSGVGRQSLVWNAEGGDWTVLVMNADGSRPVSVRADVGATVPALPWIATGLLVGGFVFLGVGVALIAVPASRAGR